MTCSACETERSLGTASFCLVFSGAFHDPECPRFKSDEHARWVEEARIQREDERPGGIGEGGL